MSEHRVGRLVQKGAFGPGGHRRIRESTITLWDKSHPHRSIADDP